MPILHTNPQSRGRTAHWMLEEIGWGLMFGTIEKRSLFEAYAARINERPAAQRANQINEARIKG